MIRINLQSVREVEREAGRRRDTRLVVLGSALVVVLLLAVELGSRLQRAPLNREHHQLQEELKVLETRTKELSDLERNKSELEEKLKTIALLEDKKVGPVQILAHLGEAMPEQVWLIDFTENGGAATITGLALDNQTIATFMRNLGQSPYFESVDLVETTQSEQEGLALKQFVVRARLSYSGKPLGSAPPDLRYPDPPKQPGQRNQRPSKKERRA